MKNLFTNHISGLWLLNKPANISSRQYVNEFCQKLQIADAGHTGTLDPLASGLLILVTGNARKLQNFFCGAAKEYYATITLGATSLTDDAEGPITKNIVEYIPTYTEVEIILKSFIGQILQIPPQYSAIKISGQRSYNLARNNQVAKLSARPITIYNIEILSYQFPELQVKVACSSGTYIRSIARDVGIKLGCGAYIQNLKRISIGHFSLENAKDVKELTIDSYISLEESLYPYPKIVLPESLWFNVKNGQKINISKLSEQGIEITIDKEKSFFIWICNRVVAQAEIKEECLTVQRLLLTN